MKEEESIKEGRNNGKGDQKFVRESTVAAWTIPVTIFQSIYTRTYLLGLCWVQIYLDNARPFPFDDLLKSILAVIPFIRT